MNVEYAMNAAWIGPHNPHCLCISPLASPRWIHVEIGWAVSVDATSIDYDLLEWGRTPYLGVRAI
jgi:hypothetical protein